MSIKSIRLTACVLFMLCFPIRAAEPLRIVAPAAFREGTRLPIRIERLNPQGAIAKEVWSHTGMVVLGRNRDHAVTNLVEFRNGVAVLSLETEGTNDLHLWAHDFLVQAERSVRHADESETFVAGTLNGASTTWSGVVCVTNDVTVPAGHLLRIERGTLVLIDGVTTGSTAPDILVEGTIESLGTEAEPVWITCADGEANWGQIRHANGSRGSYRYTFIHRGGRASAEGHTGAGPVLRLGGSEVELDNCVVSELWEEGRAIGKGMVARDSELVIANSVFAQMRMGPEIQGTSLLCTNSYFIEMRGPDDSDGIYLHDSHGKRLLVVDSVFSGGDDDAIDTLRADVVITNCIFRGWLNESEDAKAISVFDGDVRIERCLIADCFVGVSAKTGSGASAIVRIDHSTIVTKSNGVAAAWKSNANGSNIVIHVTNSIVRGNPAIHSDFSSSNVMAGFSNLSTEWDGIGITTGDPLFLNAAAYDFRLGFGSPAIDAGDPATPPDPDGTRTDAGCFTSEGRGNTASVSLDRNTISVKLNGTPVGRLVITETSEDLRAWTELTRTNTTESPYVLLQPIEGTVRFFRFRTE